SGSSSPLNPASRFASSRSSTTTAPSAVSASTIASTGPDAWTRCSAVMPDSVPLRAGGRARPWCGMMSGLGPGGREVKGHPVAHDLVIKGGTIVDGTGADRYSGDVGIDDGRITAVGGALDGERTIDADGAVVAPGWVDVHTHYDGQATWDDELDPSFGNGVTTLVMGNCGVGFAPCPPGEQDTLIELMEGVEDIPGSALHEGVPWGAWETFPEYLDFLGARHYAMDVAAQVAHGSLRFQVMRERGVQNQD